MPGLDLPSLAILMRQPPNRPDPVSHLASGIQPVSMTNPANRVEIFTSVKRRRRRTASEKVRIVEETFEPGMIGTLGSSPPWRCPEPALHLAPALRPGGTDGRGQRPRGRTRVARCASCNGGLAARHWKSEVLERAVGAKNCCCFCRRPDEGGCGGGTDRVPGRFPVQLVRDLALVERSYESTPCGAVGIFASKLAEPSA